jgi:hypothetical protein
MNMSPSTRLITALLMLVSLLYAQLAVAAYACPLQSGAPTKAAMAVASMAEMPGCTEMGMDKSRPALCGAHCDAGHQSADTPAAPVVAPFIPCALELVLPPLAQAAAAFASASESLPLTRSTAPPLSIQHCCFRI